MSAKIDNGGNAFPYLESDSNGQYRHHYGMTMRDYFMAHAPNVPDSFERKSELKEVQVPAPEVGKGYVKWGTTKWVEDDLTHLVRWRTTYADAMLAARKEVTK